jgi:hypothetical protein
VLVPAASSPHTPISTSAFCVAVSDGEAISAPRAAPGHLGRRRQRLAHAGSVRGERLLECRLGVRAREGDQFCHVSRLDQSSWASWSTMSRCAFDVDGPAQDALGTGHRQGTDLHPQLLAGPVGFLLDLGLCGTLDALAFLAGAILCFVDDLRRAAVCLLDDRGSLDLRILELAGCTILCQLQVAIGPLCSCQPIRDALRARIHGPADEGPDELHAEPHEDQEGDGLAYQCQIDVHAGHSCDRINRCQADRC